MRAEAKVKKTSFRREPAQQRALVTVEAMLDAVVKLLKRGGASSITTNRIAETAGGQHWLRIPVFPKQTSDLYRSAREAHWPG